MIYDDFEDDEEPIMLPLVKLKSLSHKKYIDSLVNEVIQNFKIRYMSEDRLFIY